MADDISIPSPTYRVPRHSRGMDPGTRKLALIATGIGCVLIAVGGGWHVLTQHREGVPVVQPEPGPMRVKPANPGGLQVAGANNDIFSGGSDTNDAKLAPPPQTPDPQALRAMEPPKAAPVHMRPPAQMTAAPTAIVQPPPLPVAREAAPVPVPAAPAPTAKPTVAALAPPAARTEDQHAATADTRQPAAGGGVQVQLAALSSEQAARTEWDRLEHRWPDLLRGHQPAFSQTQHDGHVFWRVRASGFADLTQAAVFCEHIRAKGGGCSIADF